MTGFPAVLDLPPAHRRALSTLLRLVPPAEFPWVLTGSAGLRLQGVEVDVHDLDLQSDEHNIYRIEKRLEPFMTTPVHPWVSPAMRSLDGRAELETIEVELLANLAHLEPDGSWSSFTEFTRTLWIDLDHLRIPVFPLQDERQAYQAMGRTEKVRLIDAALSRRDEKG